MANDVATLTKPAMKVGHSTAKNPVMAEGRRDFFTYRDLAVKDASGGQMRAQLTKAKTGITEATGWHYHLCDNQFVYVLKGWITFRFAGVDEAVTVHAGSGLSQPAGVAHNVIARSDDLEVLELNMPAA